PRWPRPLRHPLLSGRTPDGAVVRAPSLAGDPGDPGPVRGFDPAVSPGPAAVLPTVGAYRADGRYHPGRGFLADRHPGPGRAPGATPARSPGYRELRCLCRHGVATLLSAP